jgi:hypothetical protein
MAGLAMTREPNAESSIPVSLEERIRRRAHELYLQRGAGAGSDVEDWLQAEEEILAAEQQTRQSSK